MTSQLNVDTIVDKAGSGGSNVKIANNSVTVGEGGSGTTTTVQGLLKLWSQFNGINASLKDSFNVSSLTDNATGRFTNNFTTNMGSANYCVTAATSYSSQSGGNTSMSAEHDDSDYGRTTSAITTESAYDSSTQDRTLYDYGDQNVKVAGDLS